MQKTYTVTQAIVNNQLRGLALADKQKLEIDVIKLDSE